MNRTLHFGEGLFETILWRGENDKLHLHYERLSGSANFLGIPCPSYGEFLERIRTAVGGDGSRKYVKFLLYSAGGRRYWEEPEGYEVEVIVDEPPPIPESVSLCFSGMRVHSSDPLRRYKTTSYLFNVLVKRDAIGRGFHDGIILNEEDLITECSSSNLLLVKGSRLITPAREVGLLWGTTLEYLRRRTDIVEERLKPENLFECEGVFILNSLIGAVPVQGIEGSRIPVNFEVLKTLRSLLKEVL